MDRQTDGRTDVLEKTQMYCDENRWRFFCLLRIIQKSGVYQLGVQQGQSDSSAPSTTDPLICGFCLVTTPNTRGKTVERMDGVKPIYPPTTLLCGGYKMYLHFLSFLNVEVAQVVDTHSYGTQGPNHLTELTHLSLDKMAAISQTIFSDSFSSMKSFVFWFKFHWGLLLRVCLTGDKPVPEPMMTQFTDAYMWH